MGIAPATGTATATPRKSPDVGLPPPERPLGYDVHDELAATQAAAGRSPWQACRRLARMLDEEAGRP